MKIIILLSLANIIFAESQFEQRKIGKISKNFENLERVGENFEFFIECTQILSAKMNQQQAANICTDVHQKSPLTVGTKLLRKRFPFQIMRLYEKKSYIIDVNSNIHVHS